ncbi:uncharacterized protein LOC100370716 [Saccoglossus kowalevskii]
MSSHNFPPGADEHSDQREDQRPNQSQGQDERKPESVVRPTSQQAHLSHVQPIPISQPHGPSAPPMLQPLITTQPPTETVKPFSDSLTMSLQKPVVSFPIRPIAPAPTILTTIAGITKIQPSHMTVALDSSVAPLTGLPGQTSVTNVSHSNLLGGAASTIPLASIIKGTTQSQLSSPQQVPSTQPPSFTSHVPRVQYLPSVHYPPQVITPNSAAAAATLSAPKSGITTAMLRPQTMSGLSPTTTVQSVMPVSLQASLQRLSSASSLPRSASPITSSTPLTVSSEGPRLTSHLQSTLGLSLHPQPLPATHSQSHLQTQTHPQTQPQTQVSQPSMTQTLPQSQLVPPTIQAALRQDLSRATSVTLPNLLTPTITLPPPITLTGHHMQAKYLASLSAINIPKPIISTTTSVTSVAATVPPTMSTSSTLQVSSPHTASVVTVPASTSIFSHMRSSLTPGNTSSNTQVTTVTSNIPVAKVYPRQQQLPHSPRTQPDFPSESPSMFLAAAAAHRSSPNPAMISTVAASLPVSAVTSDTRAMSHAAQYTGAHTYLLPPTYDPTLGYAMHSYGVPFTSAVRPGFAPQGSSVAAAAMAAAAHAATVGAAPVRINPLNLMPVDQRQQMAPIPGTIATASEGLPVDGSAGIGGMYAGAGSLMNIGSSTTISSNNLANPSASPRPSILRKRTNEGLRKPVVSTPTGSQPGSPKTDSSQSTLSATSSPKPSDGLSLSQQSVEMNVVDSSTNTMLANNDVIRIKQEPDTIIEGVLALNTSVPQSTTTVTIDTMGASPRKKPRKQQHIVATEDHDMVESNSTDEADEGDPRPLLTPKKSTDKSKDDKKQAKEVKYIQYLKRPYKNLLEMYRQSWNPAVHHFHRYADVKVKDKKSTIQDIASQKGIVQKANGWKIQHIASQIDDLTTLEQEVFDKMKEIKEGLGSRPCKLVPEDEMVQISELVQGNIQRSQLAMEQMSEARHSMLKVFEHKSKVVSILNKHASKRNSKKKNSNS